MTREFKEDLETLIDYTQSRKEREDFFQYLIEYAGYDEEDIQRLREGDEATWKDACLTDNGHIYAVAWRLRRAMEHLDEED